MEWWWKHWNCTHGFTYSLTELIELRLRLEAASLLDEAISITESLEVKEEEDETMVVERATCRLHEALCLFKDGRPGDCVEVCSDVLEDGVTVVYDDDDDESGESDKASSGTAKTNAAVVKIMLHTQPFHTTAHSCTSPSSSCQVTIGTRRFGRSIGRCT